MQRVKAHRLEAGDRYVHLFGNNVETVINVKDRVPVIAKVVYDMETHDFVPGPDPWLKPTSDVLRLEDSETFDAADVYGRLSALCCKRGKSSDERKLARSVVVERRPRLAGEIFIVRLYSTEIFKVWVGHSQQCFELAAGGWPTMTTRKWINALLPPGFSVESEDRWWMLTTPHGTTPFTEKMIITNRGGLVSEGYVHVRSWPKGQHRVEGPANRSWGTLATPQVPR